jgi:hypothetical protein
MGTIRREKSCLLTKLFAGDFIVDLGTRTRSLVSHGHHAEYSHPCNGNSVEDHTEGTPHPQDVAFALNEHPRWGPRKYRIIHRLFQRVVRSPISHGADHLEPQRKRLLETYQTWVRPSNFSATTPDCRSLSSLDADVPTPYVRQAIRFCLVGGEAHSAGLSSGLLYTI